jgi:hypothetical protein
VTDVVQVLTSYQNPPDLRLRTFTQTSAPLAYGLNDLGQQQGQQSDQSKENKAQPSQIIQVPDSPLTGVAIDAGSQPLGVQIVEEADVEGTICDCGEILLPVAGIPKWPLLFLGAIPFFFIHDGNDTPTPTPPHFDSSPTPTPTPTATPTPVPEPGSLLLLGTGIIAGAGFLRRRYFSRVDQQDASNGGGLSR